MIPPTIRAVLLDIEGTVAPIAFVKEVMFPRAAAALPAWVAAHADDPDVAADLDLVCETVRAETGRALDRAAAVDELLRYIAADRKHPALKNLQGRIWDAEFRAGSLVAPIYDDVPPALDRLRAHGVRLAVYSSGSVLAQRRFFRYSTHGDLSPGIADWFDLSTGPKQSPDSYRAIASALALPPAAVLFLSDAFVEVEAARTAGMSARQVARPADGTTPAEPAAIRSFDELVTDPAA